MNENLLENSNTTDPAVPGEIQEQETAPAEIKETSTFKQIRDQLKIATKELNIFKASQKALDESEALKRGEFDKLISEKDASLSIANSELEALKRQIAISESLDSQSANSKYKDLILKALEGVPVDELGEKVVELKTSYPEFFASDKIQIPASSSNFTAPSTDKIITAEQYNAMLKRGENAIDLLNQGYKFNL